MEKKYLDVREFNERGEREWLTDAFKRANKEATERGEEEIYPLNAIPTNCIFDKTICGLGATHSELNAARNSIIIEPNVPVIKGKTGKNKMRLGVYDGVQERTIKNYLLNGKIKFKKILCTPEGYLKVRSIRGSKNDCQQLH